jgi:hypothetical protein
VRPVPDITWRQVPGPQAIELAFIVDRLAGLIRQYSQRHWRGRLTGAQWGFAAGRSASQARAIFLGRWRRATVAIESPPVL